MSLRPITTERHRGSRLPYQPGLDGLRALAVAGVFLYHANVGWMPGGFLGVDLFFVLSGYLITSLLMREWGERGSIELGAFWGRRARRLFPAVAVLILFALLAALTLARDDLDRTRTDALSAVVYLTNWHEIVASHSYFSQFGRPSLLQHLWSLAVEEQFYLVWPLLLIVGLRRLRRGGMVALTAALAAGSCALMWLSYSPAADPSRLYYGTDTRAFTLLIGALLAFAWPAAQARLHGMRRSKMTVEAVGVAALAGVLALFVSLHDFDPWLYRGGFLLMAVLGAALVGAVAYPGTRLERALGCRPLRWLGARSYGIYLWHWPIMELTRPQLDVALHGAPLIVLQAAFTVAAAALSYRYVEMPIRSGSAQKRLKAWLDRHSPHQRLAWVSGAAIVFASLAGLGVGLPAPAPDDAFASTATASARQTLTRAPSRQVRSPSRQQLLATRLISGAHSRTAPNRSARAGVDPSSAARAHIDPTSRNRGTLPAGPILAVGDSVMLGCAPDLEQRLGHRLRVDAIVGRQAEQTIGRLAQYRAVGRLPATVIVQIGDNGPVWYADMQHLRRVLRGVTHVVLVNVRLARSWEGEVDHELAQYARTWPQAVIANWYAHSSQTMLTDGVHPSISAREAYARVIVDALKGSGRAGA
ncbi:MAG: acyltransferase [Acidobacteriota bacterium]|nr:acyltransferase [Acidobacteriota bacterium]